MNIFDQIKELGEELGPLSSRLNVVIKEEEKRIFDCGASVRAEVKLIDNTFLVWSRYGNEWRLLVRYHPEDKAECLVNSSRELRIIALEQIGRLHEAILASQQAMKTRIARVLDGFPVEPSP